MVWRDSTEKNNNKTALDESRLEMAKEQNASSGRHIRGMSL